MGYYGVVGETVVERVIEKSRFLGYIARTANEEEAKSFLLKVRGMHPLATHVCYGYIADNLGNLQRFSDDGEPQGTAGMPILGVLKAQKLFETTVAVVRYFGGIKLGAGGLTRAYASTAAEAVDSADRRSFEPCVELKISVGYPEINALMRFLEGREIVDKAFDEGAAFTVAVKEEERERFLSALADSLNGKVRVEDGKRYFYPFPM